MKPRTMLLAATMCLAGINSTTAHAFNENPAEVKLTTDLLNPEVLWSMGRIGSFSLSNDGKQAIFGVTHYNIEKNKGKSRLFSLDMATKTVHPLSQGETSENAACFLPQSNKIAYMTVTEGINQVWTMNTDGSNRTQITFEKKDVTDFLFSPDEKKIILIMEVPTDASIAAQEQDLPLSSGMVINDLMYKHWDQYITAIPHPFVGTFDGKKVTNLKDILEGEAFECPTLPFGGIEQLAWSPDSKEIAYSCRKKNGVAYAVSTDSDIFLYNLQNGSTINLCKAADYQEPSINNTISLEKQPVNISSQDNNMGYDTNPSFSPDGKYISWLSMERDGYESDRTRLCIYNREDASKRYLTESFESGVNDYLWKANAKEIIFTGVWHGKTMIYQTNLKAEVKQLTDEQCDFALVGLTPGKQQHIIAKRQSMSTPDEVFLIETSKKGYTKTQLTQVNTPILSQLTMGDVKERWVKTVDGKEELCWVIYPPHFDPNKKYPTLLFCEGGPQSPVSQFWSYRWNFQIMAANGYIVIAPNRRGLPGFGMEWLEQISGDYTGLCMQDYLSAIDDICKESYVDTNRLGCVGASFGGFSAYWLAGHHNKRFKCFIAHDGIYNTQQQYVETEELWFPNWDMKRAPWIKDEQGKMASVYENSPHLFVDKWDAPILCIHGQKDFRIEYTQAQSAFTAAKLRGIPAQMLLFPDENHWVLKPQNGILWQRTFFRWLDKWLKSSNK